MKLIVWDYDNTLADTLSCLVASHQEVCRSYNIPLWDPKDVMMLAGGYGSNTRWPVYLPADKQDEALERYHQRCLANSNAMVKLFPYTLELLSLCKERGAVQVITSHKDYEELISECDRLGITPFMDSIVGVNAPNLPAGYVKKPDKRCVAHLLEKYQPDEILVIGDGLSDMKLAKNLDATGILIHPELLMPDIPYTKYFKTHKELFLFLQDYL